MDNQATQELLTSPEVQMLVNNREDAWNYRLRRHSDWDENYELYRDKPQINRLLQRQSVNVPLMKQTVRTLLKDVDDMPELYYTNIDNDKDVEILINAYWEKTKVRNNMSIQHIVDVKQDILFGRSFDFWQIQDGMITMAVEDPMDWLVPRYINPFDIDSARFLIKDNIYMSLDELEADPRNDKATLAELRLYFGTTTGLLKAKSNEEAQLAKNQKLSDLGVPDMNDPILGQTIVQCSMQFIKRSDFAMKSDDGKEVKDAEGNTKMHEEQIIVYFYAEDKKLLFKERLEAMIGETSDHFWRNHYPVVTWAEDLERQDFWSDGTADIVRTPNKVQNAWFSQLVENRSLKNLNMNIFNSSLEGYTPQTWQPQAFGMYGIPVGKDGDIRQAFQQLPVADLTDSIEELNYINGFIDRATGSNETAQGVQPQRQVTLGAIQLALGEAKERIKGMSKFYIPAWERRGLLFCKFLEAASDKLDIVTVHKKGKNTNDVYSQQVDPAKLNTKSGYNIKVSTKDDKETNDTQRLNKLNAVHANMPDNPVVTDEYQRRLLEFGDFAPDKIEQAMQFEQQKKLAMASMIQGGMVAPSAPGAPTPPKPSAPPPRQMPAGM